MIGFLRKLFRRSPPDMVLVKAGSTCRWFDRRGIMGIDLSTRKDTITVSYANLDKIEIQLIMMTTAEQYSIYEYVVSRLIPEAELYAMKKEEKS